MANLDKNRPFLGLETYTEQHKQLFGGRDTEIARLASLVERFPVNVVYGKSGSGKSSLLQAGLIPKLRKNFYRTVYVRLNFADQKVSPLAQLKNAMSEFINHIDTTALQNIDIDKLSLWEFFSTVEINNGMVSPVIILDQFEEIFTIGKQNTDGVNELIEELQCLVENRLPKNLFDKELAYSQKERKYRIIFALREDYLAHLMGLQSKMPELRRSGFRVTQMKAADAVQSIMQAGKGLIEMNTARAIVDKLPESSDTETIELSTNDYAEQTGEKEKVIEPFLLSLFCYQLNERRIDAQMPQITDQLVAQADVSGIVATHYDNSFRFTDTKTDETVYADELKKAIENELITQEGYRKLEYAGSLTAKYRLNPEHIDTLVDKRIIRKTILNNLDYIELIHDVLAPIVQTARDVRHEREEEARAEFERQEELRISYERIQKEKIEREKLELFNLKINKLLVNSKELLKLILEDEIDNDILWLHFYNNGILELNNNQFERALKFFKFAKLSPDLSNDFIEEINNKVSILEYLDDCNNRAVEYYRSFQYFEAKNEYLKILAVLPNNLLIEKRIWYCENPVFKTENLILIQGGSFIMGNGSHKNNPRHKVALDDFYLNKFQVTNIEYAEFLTIYGSSKVKSGIYKGEIMIESDYLGLNEILNLWNPSESKYLFNPVVRISWYGAAEFCKFWNGNLPSEAQWEFAARSRGKDYKYSWGNKEPNNYNEINKEESSATEFGNIADRAFHEQYPNDAYTIVFNDGFSFTSPVGSFIPNEIGLYDMSGNVWEWCADWFDADFYLKENDQNNPINMINAQHRVYRGGGWISTPDNCQTWNRSSNSPGFRNRNLGFRFSKKTQT